MTGMLDIPEELVAEHDALIKEIYAAFEGVTREDGVSWSETKVNDTGGTGEECLRARLKDTDQSWTELATNENWDAGPGTGGWSFLDPIGFRYYLPAAMIRELCGASNAFTCHSLDQVLSPRPRTDEKDWSLLNDRQLRCVARFVRFLMAISEAEGDSFEAELWSDIYHRNWSMME